MKIKKNWVTLFIYLSVIFLIVRLYNQDLLNLPKIYNLNLIFWSVAILILGFVMQGVAWYFTLNKYNYNTNIIDCIISFGVSILGKYIPGKLWMVLGKAGYISQKYSYPLDSILTISLNTQFITLWSGLFLGSFGLLFFDISLGFFIFALICWVIITLFIFNYKIYIKVKKLLEKIFKKNFNIPYINIKNTISVLPFYFIFWICFSFSFYLYAIAITQVNIDLGVLFAFPLAGTIGILVIFAPGGIGVREGLLLGYLTAIGLDNALSANISIFSRIWFLFGELSIFFFSVIAKKKYE